MSNADRIEELRTKYEENPRRYFAPLANEYRKAGDLSQAIAICREHLPKQPGHMSGYIVYGQTLFEANNLEEARTVFEQALSLDPENLIALKHLGDIARMNGENSVARRWYSRVLDADPRNDDIASQLASLGAPTPVMPVAAIPDPTPAPEPTGGEAVGVFATFDPSSLLDVPEDVVGNGGNQFWAPAQPEARVIPQHEPLDLDFPESPEPVAEEDFEEGILAPEWPDTADLVARVVTPLRSATPISTPALPETVAAFGREAYDEVEHTLPDAPVADDLVDAFLPPEPVTRAETVEAPAIESDASEIAMDTIEMTAADSAYGDITHNDVASTEHDSHNDGVSQSDIITGEVVMPAEARASAPSFLEELASFDDEFESAPVVAEVASVEAKTIAAIPDEDVVWADSIAASSEPPVVASNELLVADEPARSELTVDEVAAGDVVASEVVASDDAAIEKGVNEAVANEAVTSEAVVSETVADDVVVDEFETEEFATDAVISDAITAEFVAPAPVATESRTIEFLEAEPEEGLPVEADDDLAFAAELPWQSDAVASEPVANQLMADADAIASGDTAEFEVVGTNPEALFIEASPSEVQDAETSFAEASFAEVAPFSAEESFADVAPAVAEESFAEVAPVAAEESFADVASQVEAEKATPFVTETMAELLVAQGFLPRAIEVYDELVRRRPNDPVLVARLHELRALHEADELSAVEAAAAEAAAASAVANLAATSSPTPVASITPLYNTPVRNTPVYNTPLYNTPLYNTPLYNTPLSNTPLSNTPLSSAAHATPLFNTPLSATPLIVPAVSEGETVSNVSERHSNDRLQAFRTARERFAELSRRRVARRTPTHATAVTDEAAEGLSSLFGTAVPATTDELAARALADAFGPVQDSGESLFDPAPAPTPALPMRSLTPRHSTPAYTPATPDKQGSDRQPAADYSFDRFFPDPAMAGREGQSMQGTLPASNSTQPVNEDLAQFSAWLKGLNNT